MAKSEEEIKQDIKGYVSGHGGTYKQWYVGVTSDPRKRLFQDHNVSETTGSWIYREASSASATKS